jgi:hypothetical protein
VREIELAQGSEVACDSVWCFLNHIYDKGGPLVILFLFVAYVFYRLVWKVWSTAMESKDKEIERLIEERNFYQEKVFPGRLSTNLSVSMIKEDKK